MWPRAPEAPGGASPSSGRKTPPGPGWGQWCQRTQPLWACPAQRALAGWAPCTGPARKPRAQHLSLPRFPPWQGIVASARLAWQPQHPGFAQGWVSLRQVRQLSWDSPSLCSALPPCCPTGHSSPWVALGQLRSGLCAPEGLQPQHTAPSSRPGMFLASI